VRVPRGGGGTGRVGTVLDKLNQHTMCRCFTLLFSKLLSSLLSPFCVAFPMCIAADCSWSLCTVLLSCVYCCHLMCICCTMCVLLFFLNLDAGLLARSQYSEGPATGHLDTGFSWFPSVYK